MLRNATVLLALWLVLARLALAQEPLDARIRQETPLELQQLSPYVAGDAFRFVTPAVLELRERLRGTERMAQQRGWMVHHVFQGLYGSGFLPLNPVGNDLDAIVGVHLGSFRLEHPDVCAREMLTAIEQYLVVLDQTFSLHETPEMAIMRFRLLQDGRLKLRPVLQQRLRDSLEDVARRREHVVLVDSLYGLRVPTVLQPDESYVYETTRIELVSDRVRSTDWMAPGIRGFQVMFHFYCDLEVGSEVITDFALHPTFVPSGKVLRLQEDPLGVVPMDRDSASFFSRVALKDARLVAEHRVEMMTPLLAEVDRNLGAGDSIKALKRLYQGANALGPALAPELVARLESTVGRALNDDDVQLCNEIGTLAELAGKTVDRPEALAEYLPDFTMARVLIKLSQDLNRLDRRHPGRWKIGPLDQELSAAIELVRAGAFPQKADREKLRATLKAVETFAKEAMRAFMPPVAEVRELRQQVARRLEEAGLRPLAVYGLEDGTLGVLQPDVSELSRQGAPPFPYRSITESEIPLDNRKHPVPPSALVWLTVGPGLEELLDQLAVQPIQTVSETETALLRRQGRERFLKRFGAPGERAWSQSRTGGDGLLALLGTGAEGEALLARHLELIGDASRAARALPGEPAVALERGLRATSERILEGLAVGRASRGRRGLTLEQAREAQRQLGQLQEVLVALAEGKARLTRREDVFVLEAPAGEVLVRARPTEGRQARIAVTPGGPDSLQMRLDYSKSVGAAVDLQFSDARLDWGVHGAMATEPTVTDHHFPDGLPSAWQRPHSPRERDALVKSFAAYVEGQFVPLRLK